MKKTDIGREILMQLGALQLHGMDPHLPAMDKPVVKASCLMEKLALKEAHMRFLKLFGELERDWQLLKAQGTKSASLAARPARKKSFPPDDLRTIRLFELKVGTHHHGRVMYGTLCVDAFFLSLIQTIIEDEDGMAARILIDDVSSKGPGSWAEVQAQYPKGMKIAIKEPFLLELPDESVVLYVESADELVILSDAPKHASEIKPWANLNAGDLRIEGNCLFSKQDWAGAIELYSRCIQKSMDTGRRKAPSKSKKKVSSDNGVSSNGRVACEPINPETIMLAYSNRAAAWMKMHHYEKAVSDADEALALDPSHLKSLYRKGSSLHALQQYEQACACFKGALDHAPQDKDIQLALQRSKICDLQSQTGDYELSKYLLSGCEGSPPECSDYVGPVEIRWSEIQGRRGLFVNKDVEVGELLLVSNPLAVVRIDGSNQARRIVTPSGRTNPSIRDDLLHKLANLALKSPKWLQQLTSFDDCDCHNKSKVPSMELFRPNSKQMANSPDTTSRLKGVIMQNALDESGSSAKVLLAGRHANEGQFLGLWPLLCFINHSCAPNSVRLHVGDAIFLHASRRLEIGEEVTLSYVNTLLPARMRQELLAKEGWDFPCSCTRCELETKWKTPLNQVSKRFGALWGWKEAVTPGQVESFKMAKLALRLEHVLKLKGLYLYERQLIRASFFVTYWLGYLNIERLGDNAINLPPPEALIEAMTAAAPGDAMSLFFAAYWLKRFEEQGASRVVVGDAQKRAMHICRCLYGKQKSEVLKWLIKAQTSK